MDAKQFLELNDRMIAFNTIMKGELVKEAQAAKEALDLLGGVKAAKEIQAQLEKEKAAVDAYKAQIEAKLDKAVEASEARSEALDKADLELSLAKAALEAEQLQFAGYKSNYEAKAAASVTL